MADRKISDITEEEFLALVKKIDSCDFDTEEEDNKAVEEFVRLSEHPSGTDLLFYPAPSSPDTPESIVAEVKAWRAANGKPGFKASPK